jgi:nitrite reductase/ring-hydroxylating ferredoxin subunit
VSDGERLTATPAGVRLCALSDIPDQGARNFVLQLRAGRFHGFVVRHGDMVRGFVDRCPHMGLPLALTLDQYLTPGKDLIACGWHGALFTIDDGHCVGGPCAGANLIPWPVAVDGSDIRTT